MIKLTKEQILDMQEAYKQEFGVVLTYEETELMMREVLELLILLAKPLPSEIEVRKASGAQETAA